MTSSVGIIGLGAIGLPLAINMIGKGLAVHGYRRGAMDEFAAAGGKPAASPKAVADAAELVALVLPNFEACRDALEGPQGALKTARKGVTFADLNTLAPAQKDELKALIERAGHRMLDCPLSGVPQMVKNRAAIVFVSGDKALYERHKAAFDAMSDKAFYLGEFGVGTKMKFVANTLVIIHIAAAAEALALGMKAGLDGDLMLKLLTPSAGGSLQFQVRAPLMVARKYEPALAPITVLGKDLANIVPFAEALGCPSPLLHAAESYFRKAYEGGLQDKDCAALFDVAAAASGIELG